MPVFEMKLQRMYEKRKRLMEGLRGHLKDSQAENARLIEKVAELTAEVAEPKAIIARHGAAAVDLTTTALTLHTGCEANESLVARSSRPTSSTRKRRLESPSLTVTPPSDVDSQATSRSLSEPVPKRGRIRTDNDHANATRRRAAQPITDRVLLSRKRDGQHCQQLQERQRCV